MADLIERLEKATEPEWELDAAIARLDDIREAFGDCADDEVPPYTSSIDAALTLVPEGCKWLVQDLGIGFEACTYPRKGVPCAAKGAAPAIALCIAALKARSA